MAEEVRERVAQFLNGIDRYNPENLTTLEQYVHLQAHENTYDLDANLAVLKLYQFNPVYYQTTVTTQILLKSLMNLPNADFLMCRCLIDDANQQDATIQKVIKLAELMEKCCFTEVWKYLKEEASLIEGITGFQDAVRKFAAYVIGITYQTIDMKLVSELLGGLSGDELQNWITKESWTLKEDGKVLVANQEGHIKSKNIVEKIDFDSVAGIIAATR